MNLIVISLLLTQIFLGISGFCQPTPNKWTNQRPNAYFSSTAIPSKGWSKPLRRNDLRLAEVKGYPRIGWLISVAKVAVPSVSCGAIRVGLTHTTCTKLTDILKGRIQLMYEDTTSSEQHHVLKKFCASIALRAMSALRLVRAPTCPKLHRLLYSYESKVIGPISPQRATMYLGV